MQSGELVNPINGCMRFANGIHGVLFKTAKKRPHW